MARMNTIFTRIYKQQALIYEVGQRFECKPLGAYKRNASILHVMCSTQLFAHRPPLLYLNSEYTCTIDDFQGFTYSVLQHKVMYNPVYGHITKYHEGNACLSPHSLSPRSVRSSFISPLGRRFEYKLWTAIVAVEV